MRVLLDWQRQAVVLVAETFEAFIRGLEDGSAFVHDAGHADFHRCRSCQRALSAKWNASGVTQKVTIMSWPINVFAGVLLGAISMQVPAKSNRFVGTDECGFEFSYPSDWVIVPAADPPPCSVRLRPQDFAAKMKELDVDVYTLNVAVDEGHFLAVAEEQFFDFVKGRWVLVGRQGITADADVVSTERWHGLRGHIVTGCFYEGGGYAGLCEDPVLVLRDDDDNVWWMRGGPQSEKAFEAILASFRFRGRR